MLTNLLSKLIGRTPRQWTEREIRELMEAGEFDQAWSTTTMLHRATPDFGWRKQCLQAEIAFRTHRDEDADFLYNQVLKEEPGFVEAHYGLSLLKHSKGDYDGAFQHVLFALGSAPAEPRYLAQLGLCHICLGNHSQAEEVLRRSLNQAPHDKASWNNLGLALLIKGQVAEARSCFSNALRLDPNFGQARENLSQLNIDDPRVNRLGATNAIDIEAAETAFDFLLEHDTQDPVHWSSDSPKAPWHASWLDARAHAAQGDRARAISALEGLLLVYPDTAELAVLAERLYRTLGEADSGLAVLQAFLVRHPESGVAHQGMGDALLSWADYPTAERHLRQALKYAMRSESLLKALGRAVFKQDRYAEALPIYQECQEKWPSDTNLAYLAMAHHQACEYEQALNYFEQLKTDDRLARLGLLPVYAQCLAYAGQMEEGTALLSELIERQSNSNLRAVLSAFQLQLEKFDVGWDGYRHRKQGLSSYRVLPFPEWQGEDIQGKTIVVLAEQGLGDQVMFASCLPDLLARKPARVIVEVIKRVAPTLTRSFPDCEIIASRQDRNLDWLREISHVDCFVPLGDLPSHFRRSLESFPRRAYLKPDPERVCYWRGRLKELGPGPYFGTSWRGGTERTRTSIRTLTPSLLKPLTEVIPSKWISLQYGNVEDELMTATSSGVCLTHWPEAIADLDEFAALIAALDGVFTACNTTVHYAGALGQRTWVLAPSVPEWRYGLRSSHMPWYPHVEVLRQPTPGAWSEVIAAAEQRLSDKYRT